VKALLLFCWSLAEKEIQVVALCRTVELYELGDDSSEHPNAQ